MIFDIHPHVLSADDDTYPLAPISGAVSGWASSRPVTTEQLLSEMDAAGIAKAALVQASTAYGYDNSYVLDSAAAHPGRFVAVGCVDPLAADVRTTVRELAGHPRLAGLRLFTTGSTMPGQAGWLNDPAVFPFWETIGETGLPVCVQMKISALDQLTDILDRFPSAPVVLDHMAYPPIEPGREREAAESLRPLAKYPRLHLKLTMRNTEPLAAANAAAFLEPLVAEFGSERIAWGSNFPAASQPMPELVALVRAAIASLPQRDQENILSGTAKTLYPALISPADAAP